MPFSDSNFGQVLYVSERGKYNTRPTLSANNKANTLRLTSSDFSVSKNTVVSDEVRSDRMVSTISEVGTTTTGTVNFELSLGGNGAVSNATVGTYDELLEAVLCGTWVKVPHMLTSSAARASSTTTVNAVPEGFQTNSEEFRNIDIGQWVYMRGFSTAALNKWYKIESMVDSWNVKRTSSPMLTIVDEIGAIAPVRCVWGISLYISGGTSGNTDSYVLNIKNADGTKTATFTAAANGSGRTADTIMTAIAAAIAAGTGSATTTGDVIVTPSGTYTFAASTFSVSSVVTGSGGFLITGPTDGSNFTVTAGTNTDTNDVWSIPSVPNVTGAAGVGHTVVFDVQGSVSGTNVHTSDGLYTSGSGYTYTTTNWTVASGQLVHSSGATASAATLALTGLTDGKWYSVTTKVDEISGTGTLAISHTETYSIGDTVSAISKAGYYTVQFKAVGTAATISYTPSATTAVVKIGSIVVNSGDVLSVSLKEDFGGTEETFYANGSDASVITFATSLANNIKKSSNYTNTTSSGSQVKVVNTSTTYVTQVTDIQASIPNIVKIMTDPEPSSVESGATVTLSGKMLRNGGVKRSFTIEQGFTDVNQYHEYNGQRVGSMSLDISSGAIISGSFGFQGASATYRGATTADPTPGTSMADGTTTLPATTYPTVNATENVGDITEAGEILSSTIQSVSLNVDNALRDQLAVGEKYPKGIGYGRQTVSGSLTAYFENGNLYDKFLGHQYTSLSFDAFDGTATTPYRIRITLPKVIFQSDNPNVAGIDQDVTESIDFTAIFDPVTRSQIQIDLAQ